MNLFKSVISLFLFIPFMTHAQNPTLSDLKSPNETIQVRFTLNQEGTLTYSVTFSKIEVITSSPMGVEFKKGGLLQKGVTIAKEDRSSGKETYELYSGKTSSATASYNEASFLLQETSGAKRSLQVIFRAYDEGVAFRYVFPQQKAMKEFEIIREHTLFNFKEEPTTWPMVVPHFTTSYEEFYEKKLMNNLHGDFLMAMPLTIKIPEGAYISITEAALNDYAGSYIRRPTDRNNILTTVLSPLPDGKGVAVRGKAGHKSPWRVIMIGNTPGDLVESNLVYHLNEPNQLKDAASWIRPGKCAWDWWSEAMVKNQNFTGGMNTQTMKYYIDFASEYNLEYMLVDAGWSGRYDDTTHDITKPIPDINMKEIIEYGKSKNVGIILWVNWKCVRNQMDKAFPLYREWGVKGVKMDYMDRDDQEMVNFYLKVVRKAAENKLMVNMHGAHKPSGLSRTYPNLMTYEGIRGMEYNKWARTTPTHHVTIPFTRMLAGPMDVTPGVFRNVTEEKFISRGREAMAIGTRCSQLAMFVVYESALQSVCDYPDAYRGQKGAEFLKVVPASWDETRVLSGEVGEYIVIARRKGDDWFIAGMTNEKERHVLLPLSFVWNKKFEVTIYADGPKANEEPTDVAIEAKKTGGGKEQLSYVAKMASGGGFVMHLKAVK